MTTVGFAGLGRMGVPMATNLRKAGFGLTVYNRTPDKAESFAADHGCNWVADASKLTACDVVISMVADDEALSGIAEEIVPNAPPGLVMIDMSTVSPALVRALSFRFGKRGAVFVDAPVSGSVAAATDADLAIMVGGAENVSGIVTPILQAMGSRLFFLGQSGTGSALKLAVNTIVHGLNASVSEALVLAERAGIDRLDAYEVFANSAVTAPFVTYRRAAFEDPETAPVAFRLDLAAKDLELAIALAGDVGAELPQAGDNLRVLNQAIAAGLGQQDMTAVATHLRTSTSTSASENGTEEPG